MDQRSTEAKRRIMLHLLGLMGGHLELESAQRMGLTAFDSALERALVDLIPHLDMGQMLGGSGRPSPLGDELLRAARRDDAGRPM